MNYATGLISIIVPVFNVKDYLDRCVESIVNQSYENIEVILVDDGSNDGSQDICDKWEERDSRISVYHKSNGGASAARNLGLEKARGEFIGFVDSDDYIDLDMYERLYADMNRDVDVVSCGRVIIYPPEAHRKPKVHDNTYKRLVFSNEEAMGALLNRQLSFSPCTKLFRRHLFNEIRFPVGRTCEDLPVIYAIVKKSRNIVSIGAIKYFNWYRPDSISRAPFRMERISYVLFARDIYKDVMVHYPKERKNAEALYFRNIVSIIRSIKRCNNKNRYEIIENRLRKVLRRGCINILLNKNLLYKEKEEIFKLMIQVKDS